MLRDRRLVGEFVESVAVEIGAPFFRGAEDQSLAIGADDGRVRAEPQRQNRRAAAQALPHDADGWDLGCGRRCGTLLRRDRQRLWRSGRWGISGGFGCAGLFARLEQVAELVLAEFRHVRQQIHADDARVFAALRGVKQDVLAVGRPGDAAHFAIAEEADRPRRTARRRNDMDVHEGPRIAQREGDILAIGRPGRARPLTTVGGDCACEQRAIGATCPKRDQVQFAVVEHIGHRLSVGGVGRHRRDAVRSQHRLATAGDIIFDQRMVEPAFGDDQSPAAVGRPHHFALGPRRVGDALRRAAILGRCRKDFAVADHRDLLPVARDRQAAEALQLLVATRCRAGGPAQRDRHRVRLAGRGIIAPHAEIALEYDRRSVRCH
ncbi:hypothetical protein D9M73_103020 [compost metagenome]